MPERKAITSSDPQTPATHNTQKISGEGIRLGEGYYWNPEDLTNGHIAASGSGKTQTLKAIAIVP